LNIRKRRCTTSLPYLCDYPLTSGNNDRLGVPESNKSFNQIEDYKKIAKKYDIEIIFLKE
jgi:hypothetical protein